MKKRLLKHSLSVFLGVFSVLVFSSCKANAATYYVDSSVADTNIANAVPDSTTYNHISFATGSGSDSVFATIADINVFSALVGGDQIFFRKGQAWQEQLVVPASGANGNPISFGAYGSGADPIINGADVVTGWSAVGGKDHLYSKSLGFSPGVHLQDGNPLRFVAWSTDIDTTYPYMTAGSYTFDTSTNIGYIWTTDEADPATHAIEVASRDYGVYALEKNYISFSNITVQNSRRHGIDFVSVNYSTVDSCTIKNIGGKWETEVSYLGNGFEMGGNSSDNAITNSTIFNIFDSGISPQLYDAASETLSDTTISGNTVYNCGYAGVEVSILGSAAGSSLSGTDIDSNIIYDAGKGWSGNRGGYGVRLNTISDNTSGISSTTLSANRIYGNLGDGLNMGNYHVGTVTIDRNAIYSNSGSGIWAEAGNTPTTGIIANYNLIYNNAKHGFYYNLSSGPRFSLKNNVFYANGNEASSYYNFYVNGPGSTGTSIVKNNIFHGTDSLAFYDLNGILAGSNQNYNLFYRASGNLLYWNGTAYAAAEFSNYKNNSGQDSNSLSADPKFVSSSNFHLQSTSPAINAGTNVSLSADYENATVPQGSAPDIGAYEYDKVLPTLSEITPIPTSSNDTTPEYTFHTDEAGNITYGGDCSSSAATAISGNNAITFNVLSGGTHSNCTIAVTDVAGNSSASLSVSSFTIDVSAPDRSGGSPSGTLSAGTSSATLSLNTDENSTCRYSTAAGTPYDSMVDTFSTTVQKSHSKSVMGLSNGNVYDYYIKCRDELGNANSDDYKISFLISSSEFIPTVSAGNSKKYFLSSGSPLSVKSKYLIFSGKISNLKNGRVEIFQNGKSIKQDKINKKNEWRIKINEKQRSATRTYQFKYYNADNQNVETSQIYTIITDRQKPRFTYLPKIIQVSPGDTISWQVTDNDQIEYYQYTFRGKKERTSSNSFVLPSLLPKRTSALKVWAFDRAGNSATRKAKIRIK